MWKLLTIVACATLGLTGACLGQDYRRDSASSQAIQGYFCAPGPVWFYAGGHLRSCKVVNETSFGEIRVPAGSRITLTPDGAPMFVFLAHDAQVGSHVCRGGGSESYSTALYSSGKLKECWLAGDQVVQGVPCTGASFLADVIGGSVGVIFHENGKLRTCKLSKDFRSLKRGDHIELSP